MNTITEAEIDKIEGHVVGLYNIAPRAMVSQAIHATLAHLGVEITPEPEPVWQPIASVAHDPDCAVCKVGWATWPKALPLCDCGFDLPPAGDA